MDSPPLLGALVGLLLGGLGHALFWPTPPAAESEASEPPAPSRPMSAVEWVRSDCPAPDSEHRPEMLALVERRTELQELEDKLARFIGRPQDFPPDLDERYRPDNAEQALLDELEGIPGASLDYVDCSEFPCVAVFDTVDDIVDDEATSEALGAMGGKWRASRQHLVLLLADEGSEGDSRRAAYRLDVAMDDKNAAWDESNP